MGWHTAFCLFVSEGQMLSLWEVTNKAEELESSPTIRCKLSLLFASPFGNKRGSV